MRIFTFIAWGLVAIMWLGAGCSGDSDPTGPGNGNGGEEGDNLPSDPNYLVFMADFASTVFGVWGFEDHSQIAVGGFGAAYLRAFIITTPVYAMIPVSVTNNLNAVWAAAHDDVFAVGNGRDGEAGVILHFDGAAVNVLDHDLTGNITSVFGLSGSDVYATGEDGWVAHYDGSGWTQVYTHPTGVAWRDVWASTANNVFVVGDGGNIVRFTGTEWLPSETVGPDFKAVWGTTSVDVWAVGGQEIWILDGLTEWDLEYESAGLDLQDIHGTNDQDIWAVSEDDVLHFDGSMWQMESVGFGAELQAVWADTEDNVIVFGSFGEIYRYNGSEWQREKEQGKPLDTYSDVEGLSSVELYTLQRGISSSYGAVKRWNGISTDWTVSAPTRLSALWCAAENQIYGPGSQDGFDQYVYLYNAPMWTNSWLASVNVPADIWGVDHQNMFIACDYGTVYYKTGQSWTPASVINPVQHLHGIHGTSATDVFVVGENGTIVHFDGVNWTPMNSNTTVHLRAVWSTSEGSVTTAWAVGDDGTVVRYGGNGLDWSLQDVDISSDLYAVSGSAADHVWAVGDNSLVIRYSAGDWKRIPVSRSADQVHSVWVSSESSAWLGCTSGYLLLAGPME